MRDYVNRDVRKSAIGTGSVVSRVKGKMYILTGQKPVEIEGTENAMLLPIQAGKRAL